MIQNQISKQAENIIKTTSKLSKRMKITKILQKPNKNHQANQKYEPLRKNIQSPKQPVMEENIQKVSFVSNRLKSLSPNQREVIVHFFNKNQRTITYIPENCGLKVTSSEQKQQKALGQKYVAINMQERTRTKPITPNTFQNVVKNQKVEVVYEYNYEQVGGEESSQRKKVGNVGDTSITNTQIPNQVRNGNLPLGRNIYTEHQASSRNNIYYANEDNGNSDVPAFWQRQNINKYNQLGRNSKQQYEVKSKKQANNQKNIEIGGRSKSTTKHTIEDFQSSIGINSRHLKNNMTSTKDYSKNHYYNKEDILEGQETEVKGDYSNDPQSQDQNSRVRGYVQSVQSRIETGNSARFIGDINFNKKLKEKHKEVNHQQFNAQNQINQPLNNSTPQIEERQRKLKEYQQSQGKGYSFKKNQQTQDHKRNKQQYKYNLYSVCDEQFNLMCKTGLFTPNEICASEPKREGWS